MGRFRVDEGCFDLQGAWQDRSVTMLVPAGLPQGVNLVLTRDQLPPGAGLQDHLARQMMSMRRDLTGLTVLADSETRLDGRSAHLLEFRWANRSVPLYQMLLIVVDGDRLLNFTATAPGQLADQPVRQALWQAISSFTFAAEQAPE